MPSPVAKRALFSASTPRKRAKTKTVVVRAKSESKYDDQYLSLSTGYGDISLPSAIVQGDGQGQHIGSKLRILAVECRYDFQDSLTKDSSAVIRMYIPKDPSSTSPSKDPRDPLDPTQFVILHEEYISPNTSMTGMFRWKGPVNVQFSGDLTTVLKNNIRITCRSKSNASTISIANVRTWYTDN